MIYLPYKIRDTRNIPNSLERQSVYKKLNTAIINGSGEIFTSDHYGKPDVRNRLRAYSIGKENTDDLLKGDIPKCYFCESNIEHSAVLNVEHFRPKAKVEAQDNNMVKHKGYFWLAIEWTNLLLACPKCNQDGKRNRFPIAGVRAVFHNPLSAMPPPATSHYNMNRNQCLHSNIPLNLEIPLLVHPEYEDPYPIFTFDQSGKMYGKSPNIERGELNISILKLNRRLLVEARLEKWENIENEINEASVGLSYCLIKPRAYTFLIDKIIEKILDLQNHKKNYSLWGRYINENLPDFINILKINDRMKKYILNRYDRRIR